MEIPLNIRDLTNVLVTKDTDSNMWKSLIIDNTKFKFKFVAKIYTFKLLMQIKDTIHVTINITL